MISAECVARIDVYHEIKLRGTNSHVELVGVATRILKGDSP